MAATTRLAAFLDPSTADQAAAARALLDHMGDFGIFVSDDEELAYFRACKRLGVAGYQDLAGSMISYMTLSSEFSYT